MRVVLTALSAFLCAAAFAACVDVPDGVRAQFAAPTPAERSNFRPGAHGSAPPVEDGPRLAAPETTGATIPSSADGGAPAAHDPGVDGGIS